LRVFFGALANDPEDHDQGLEVARKRKSKRPESQARIQNISDDLSFLNKKVTRREAISTTGKVAIGAAAAIVLGGVAYAAYQPGLLTPSQPSSGHKVGDKIKIGLTISQSGILSPVADEFKTVYNYWKDQVNANGGFNLSKLGRKVPIDDLVIYDDKSDPTEAVNLYQRLLNVDKVDLVTSPDATFLVYAVAPTMEKAKIPMVANLSIPEPSNANITYTWFVASTAQGYTQPLIDFIKANSNTIKNVAIIYIQSDFPVKAAQYVNQQLSQAGFNIAMYSGYGFDANDFTNLISQAKAANADAFIAMTLVGDAFLLVKQSISAAFNPKVYWTLLAAQSASFIQAYGTEANGIVTMTNWAPKMNFPGGTKFISDLKQRLNSPNIDYLNDPLIYASMQVLQQAVEAVGDIDYAAINNQLGKGKFSTIIGDVQFQSQLNVGTPAVLGQWQQGATSFESVYPPKQATAQPVFPKPPF
jgi:branched-chain amino acid transport system substrate-binding protein